MKMRASLLLGAIVVLGASPSLGQSQAGQKESVNDYLCTFAGKCGATTPEPEATPTMAAPATKGFRLAAPQAAPAATVVAPATKGFRLGASPQPVATAVLTSPKPMALRHVASVRSSHAVAASSVGAPRANLRLAFEYNSARLTPAAEEQARIFAQALVSTELKDKRFRIEGHTDSRGPREANIDLSRRRAQAVADFLAQQGVAGDRVDVKGVGPDEPLPGQLPTAEANRRVEAVLVS